MEKNKIGFGAYMAIVAGILAIVACVLYRTVMYQFKPVYYMLIGAAVVAVGQPDRLRDRRSRRC